MVFTAGDDKVTRVLDTENTQTGALLDSMMPLADFQAWLKETAQVEEFVDTYLQDHAGDLRSLTGIAQLNERVGATLVTDLVNAVTRKK